MISAFLVILYFAKFRNMYLDRSMLKPQLKLLKAIVSLGLAACINQIAIAAVQIVYGIPFHLHRCVSGIAAYLGI